MIERNENGRYVLSFGTNAVVRRVPIEKRGVAKSGKEWFLGSVLLEAYDDDETVSSELFLITWNEEMYEQIIRIGVGKKVHVSFHIETSQKYDNYHVSCVLDSIEGMTQGEDFLYGTKKKGERNEY